jgi:hypothetical protein
MALQLLAPGIADELDQDWPSTLGVRSRDAA